MKKTLLFIALLGLSNLFAQTSKEIISFAQKNYMSIMGNIPEKQLPEFGLKSKTDLKDLKFTDVFTEFASKDGKNLPTGNFRVLVKNSAKEVCGLLTIHNSKSGLNVGDYGALELSKELNTKKSSISSGKYGIFRSYSTQSDYLFDLNVNAEKAVYHKMFSKEQLKFTELK